MLNRRWLGHFLHSLPRIKRTNHFPPQTKQGSHLGKKYGASVNIWARVSILTAASGRI